MSEIASHPFLIVTAEEQRDPVALAARRREAAETGRILGYERAPSHVETLMAGRQAAMRADGARRIAPDDKRGFLANLKKIASGDAFVTEEEIVVIEKKD